MTKNETQTVRIAFAGNPNSGKTTMFNTLTGRNEKIGNWAGVTVDVKQAPIRRIFTDGADITAVDLPGTYSISPFTSEEGVTSAYIQNEAPDAIVNIVDSTNLSRSLFFTTQLLELGIPLVVALNKSDINEKKNTQVDAALLSALLGCPVVNTVSTDSSHDDLQQVVNTALEAVGKIPTAPFQKPEGLSAAETDRLRFAFVDDIVAQVEKRKTPTYAITLNDRIDAVLTHPIVGLPIFALVMFLVFQISQSWLGVWIAEGYEFENGFVIPGLVTAIDAFKEWLGEILAGGNEFLVSLLTEGVIGGVSAVVGFLPLVMVMYFLIALLEDCGYMARATVVLDPIFKKVGLSGKSVIPFIIGTGCSIPGVMAARTIRNERERNATAMLTPFMPCGAKLPVIALFSGAFFGDAPWVGTLMYFAGISLILLGALLIRRITRTKSRTYFIIELPDYKAPSLKRACISMLEQGKAYIAKAGTIILLCNAAVFILQSFDWSLQAVEAGAESSSILATIANPVAVALIPIVGHHAWQLAAAAITGLIAKENVVGTLAVCYGFAITSDLEIESGNEVADAMFRLTKVAALAYLCFNLFTPPCFAAIGAMNAEITDKKWFWGGIALQLATGYCVGFAVYQLGTLLVTGSVGEGFLGGLVAVAVIAAIIAYLCLRKPRERSTK